MKKFYILLMLISQLWSSSITPNEVYAQVELITQEVHFLTKYYDVEHSHNEILKSSNTKANIKPRNVWQMTYEIMVKINMLRTKHNLPVIEPVNMSPILHLNPDMVYEQTQRILTEIKVFKDRMNIKSPVFKLKKFKNKMPIDVYNSLSDISKTFNELNQGKISSRYVYGENIRVFDDITVILKHLKIPDTTIPNKKIVGAKPVDSYKEGMKILDKIKQLQITVGIDFVDFTNLHEGEITPNEVFTLTQMIIAELQTIKAYLNMDSITTAAIKYQTKTPAEVAQLMSWNFRKIDLIKSLNRGK